MSLFFRKDKKARARSLFSKLHDNDNMTSYATFGIIDFGGGRCKDLTALPVIYKHYCERLGAMMCLRMSIVKRYSSRHLRDPSASSGMPSHIRPSMSGNHVTTMATTSARNHREKACLRVVALESAGSSMACYMDSSMQKILDKRLGGFHFL